MIKLYDVFPPELKERILQNKIDDIRSRANKSPKKPENLEYAFPRLKKLPLETKRNVQSAMTHFPNVKGGTEEEKTEAVKKIIKKAEEYQLCTMVFSKQCGVIK